jgi:hypothetical protein
MNMQYNRALKRSLPSDLVRVADQATMTDLGNPRVLLSEQAMNRLRDVLTAKGENGKTLLFKTVEAIRNSMEAGLRAVFIIGALTMVASFILICTIPEISMHDDAG